jgi:hypothetical protein
MLTNTAAIRVGRLLEIRADAGYKVSADVDRLFDDIEQQVRRVPQSRQVVTVVDWRRCPVMSAEAAQRVVQRILIMNPRIERSAALAVRDTPTAVLQFVRLIREARKPDRKMFFSAPLLIDWLSETLTLAESTRLRTFIAENDAPGKSPE